MKLGHKLRELVKTANSPKKENFFYWLIVKIKVWSEFNSAKTLCKALSKWGHRNAYFVMHDYDINVLTKVAEKLRLEEVNATLMITPNNKMAIHIEW